MSNQKIISLKSELDAISERKKALRKEVVEKAQSVAAPKKAEVHSLRGRHAALLDRWSALNKKLFKPKKKLGETAEELRSMDRKIAELEAEIGAITDGANHLTPEELELSDRAERIKKEIAAEEQYEIARKKGTPQAIYDFAYWCFDHGYGQRGIQNLVAAGEAGHIRAMVKLEWFYHTGSEVQQDIRKSEEWVQRAISALEVGADTDGDTLFTIGQFYSWGNAVQKSAEKAFGYYLRAAEKGRAEAMYSVGECYYNGDAIAQNYKKAASYYYRAAKESNHTGAQFAYGLCLHNGLGVKQDPDKALKYYMLAADSDDEQGRASAALAAYQAGGFFEHGFSGRYGKDLEKALRYYERAMLLHKKSIARVKEIGMPEAASEMESLLTEAREARDRVGKALQRSSDRARIAELDGQIAAMKSSLPPSVRDLLDRM